MKLDLIKNVVTELSAQISGARVSKIYQPSPEVIVFKLWNGRETLRLLVSAEGQSGRLHLTQRTWPNPHIPPRFCQLLRARVARINSLRVVNDDRIIQFDCAGKHGDCRLIVELTGNNCNMVLVDPSGVIIDVLKRVDADATVRALLAGAAYCYPPKKSVSSDQKSSPGCLGNTEGSWSQTVEKIYSRGFESPNKKDFRQQLLHAVQRRRKKMQKRLDEINRDFSKYENYGHYRQCGELLLANLYKIHPGIESLEVQNYFLQPEQTLTIQLDPRHSPQQNIENYFRKYKKSRRGLEHCERRLKETQVELEWLEQLDYQLKDNVKNSDIEEIAEELRQAGVLKENNNLHKKRTLRASKPHETTSPSGFRVVWGRNNRQNDEISSRMNNGRDLWFHANRVPGAHVVLQLPAGRQPQDADIDFAASIAAGYSRARYDSKVEVMVAGAGSVHKPKGCPAGLVNVLHYKTLMVEPIRLD